MKPAGVGPAASWLLGAFALTGAACVDLFHGTDWASRCDAHPDARGCAASPNGAADDGDGGESATASTTDGTSFTTTTSTASATGDGGNGAAGGGGSGGGSGGVGGSGSNGPDPVCSTCKQVGQVVYDGSNSPGPETLCPGAAKQAWDAVEQCVCGAPCGDVCSGSACQLKQASQSCEVCALQSCLSQLQTCEAN